MAAKTQLSPSALPGQRYTFIAKTAPVLYGYSTSAVHAVKGVTKISAVKGSTKISARVN